VKLADIVSNNMIMKMMEIVLCAIWMVAIKKKGIPGMRTIMCLIIESVMIGKANKSIVLLGNNL
jgi:hypothetical protein